MISRRREKCDGELCDNSAVCPACGTLVARAHQGTSTKPESGSRTNPANIIGLIAVCLVAGALLVTFNAGCKKPPAKPETVEVINPEELKIKADGGDADAQMKLGAAYANGRSVKQDYETAASYYRLAADQGHAGAQIALGELYEAGQGVPRDETEAARWYRRAAEQGHAAGQYAFAVMCLVGTGVPKDDAEALKWYRQSADQGYALALFHLGMRYKKGQGVAAEPAEAYKWLTLAAERGVAEATEIRDELKRSMTREQIAEGRQRAEAFAAKLPTTQPR
jgi:hypothetical protein